MNIKQAVLYLLSIALTVGFISPVNIADAFEAFPRSLAWELMDQSGETKFDANGDPYAVHYVQPGDTVDMYVTVRNMSRNRAAEVWYGVSDLLPEGLNYPNAHAIGLGTWAPMDHIPSFLDPSSFVVNDNRFAYYDGDSINKGQLMTLNFQVKIKDNIANGTYDLVVSLVREFDEWGYRVDANGNNHRYRSMLWKFVVGSNDVATQWRTYTSNALEIDITYPQKVQWPNGDIEQLVASTDGESVFLTGEIVSVSIKRYTRLNGETILQALDRIFPSTSGMPGLPAYETKPYPNDDESFLFILLGHDFPPVGLVADWITF